jgi:diguanylate cyclase (GGDEF)-like protein
VNIEMTNKQNTTPFWRVHTEPELILGSVAAAVVAATVWTVSGGSPPLAWAAVAQLIYGTRFWAARRTRLHDDTDLDSRAIRRGLQVGLIATGLLWGSASVGCLLTYGITWLSGMVTATTLALSIIVLGCYLGSRALVIPFIATAIAPIGIVGLFFAEKAAVAVGISSLLFMAVISIAAIYIDRLAASFYEARSERDKFLTMVQISEQEIKRLQIGVKTDREKALSLENELMEVNSNLTIIEGKADALSNALERVTPYDNETGLLNAKKYQNVIEREWARMLRQELPITVVHMKIDNFDDYKETYGNIAYEAAMRRIAELTRRAGTRPGDVFARLEENKYALLFPEADHKNGENLADVLRKQIRRLNIPNVSSPMHSAVSASFGVATLIPNSDLTIKEFTKRADDGLYEAQFQGGDKVVRYRTMNNIKLERWDREQEGDLTPDGLVRKLAVLGYETKAKTYRPGEYRADQRMALDSIDAIVQGRLKVSLEGEARVLNPGDCLFIPKGLVTSTEVVGEKPVICLEGTRTQ